MRCAWQPTWRTCAAARRATCTMRVPMRLPISRATCCRFRTICAAPSMPFRPRRRRSGDAGFTALIDGVELTERAMLSALERHGVKKLAPEGEKFDPNFHQAMFEVPNPDVPANTVVQVVQPGYSIGDRVLRPAMVGVAKGGPKHGYSRSGSGARPGQRAGRKRRLIYPGSTAFGYLPSRDERDPAPRLCRRRGVCRDRRACGLAPAARHHRLPVPGQRHRASAAARLRDVILNIPVFWVGNHSYVLISAAWRLSSTSPRIWSNRATSC